MFRHRDIVLFESKLSYADSYKLIADIVEEFSHYASVILVVRRDYYKIFVSFTKPIAGEFTIFARREISRITISTFSLSEEALSDIESKIIALAARYQLLEKEVTSNA